MDSQPLADRIRPQSLDDFIGQPHLVDPDGPIRKMLAAKQIFSMIFWGPPGSGKTTLARIIAKSVGANYHELSAVSAGKSDIKKIIDAIRLYPLINPLKSILFLDEIHRFNKTQQDYLLPFVEHGTLTLIGATTENPSFEVISPLLSRCRTYVFHQLNDEELSQIVNRAINKISTMKQFNNLTIDPEAKHLLIQYANGDGRTTLNVIDLASRLFPLNPPKSPKTPKSPNPVITKDQLLAVIQDKRLRYDTAGEEHYNTISAFIKSMRASNVDAAIYYLARMVESGEDPLFIARRMVIFASEDIGMAQPTALVVANEVFRACETIGYPECAINLAQATVYLAKAPKNRAAYDGLRAAQQDVKTYGNLPIPLNLRNAPTKLMKELGYGKGYQKYTTEDLLPDRLRGRKYYHGK